MNLPQGYAELVLVTSAVLTLLWAFVVVRATINYHRYHDPRAAWALATRMSVAVAALGLLVSSAGFFVDLTFGGQLAAIGLGLARGGLLVASLSLLAQEFQKK
jgi:hypothetical protein